VADGFTIAIIKINHLSRIAAILVEIISQGWKALLFQLNILI